MYYLNNFFIFSIFGFIFENIMFRVLSIHSQSGFLYLPWTPFYGIAIIIIILLNKYLSKLSSTKVKKYIILTVSLFITLTLLELSGGMILEYLHGYSLWNYDIVPLHIGKYISIPTSSAWVIMSYIYLFLIKKYSDKLANIIPKFITILLTLIFTIDSILTMIKLFSIKLS